MAKLKVKPPTVQYKEKKFIKFDGTASINVTEWRNEILTYVNNIFNTEEVKIYYIIFMAKQNKK